MSNTTGVTCGAGVAYPFGAPELTLVFEFLISNVSRNTRIENMINHEMRNKYISLNIPEQDVLDIFQFLKNGNAADSDCISHQMLKKTAKRNANS